MNKEKRNASLTTRALDKEKGGGESYSPVKDAAVSLSRAYVIKRSRRCRIVSDEIDEVICPK